MLLATIAKFAFALHMAYSGMVVSYTPWTGTQRGVFTDWVDGHDFELRIYNPDGLQLPEIEPFETVVYQRQFAGRSLVLIQGVGSFTLHPAEKDWRDFKQEDKTGSPNSHRIVSIVPNGDEMVLKIEWIDP